MAGPAPGRHHATTPQDVPFMRKCVKRHCFGRFGTMEPPSDIPQREFGYMGAD